MVVYSNRQIAFGFILSDDIFIEIGFDFCGFGHFFECKGCRFHGSRLLQNLVSLTHAFVTDISIDTIDHEIHLPV